MIGYKLYHAGGCILRISENKTESFTKGDVEWQSCWFYIPSNYYYITKEQVQSLLELWKQDAIKELNKRLDELNKECEQLRHKLKLLQ
jgi:predicted transcriptional regulator